MARAIRSQWHFIVLFVVVAGLLTALWLPGIRYPITSDTTVYALLGENLWRHGTYAYAGISYAKQLPLHAFVSYPLSWLLGFQRGMKVSSLLAGIFVLLASYFLMERAFSRRVAFLTVVFLLLHLGFVLMTMLGSADLLFTALFIGSVAAFDRAGERKSLYLLAGVLLGLASLARYNGILLFALFPVFVFWKRPKDRSSALFLSGMSIAITFLGLWFLRNTLVFGNPLHTDYSSEFQEQVPSLFREVVRNIVYYGNPLHNILPVLLFLALFGLWRHGRERFLLVLAMLAGFSFALIWWVKGIRFAFPGYPILLGFSAAGAVDLWTRLRRFRRILLLVAAATLFLHATMLCIYAYGSCNAWFDQKIGYIPSNLGLSSEGLYGISLARDFIDAHAPPGAFVFADSINAPVWRTGVFRPDLKVVQRLVAGCPAFEILQGSFSGAVLYETQSEPKTSVVFRECPR